MNQRLFLARRNVINRPGTFAKRQKSVISDVSNSLVHGN